MGRFLVELKNKPKNFIRSYEITTLNITRAQEWGQKQALVFKMPEMRIIVSEILEGPKPQ
jgi:hypothetical protein